MRAVSDSTPLIHLAKINKIIYLKKIFSKILIPEEIVQEVIKKGKEQGRKEISLIEKLIEEGFIEIKNVALSVDFSNLHSGELNAISLCKEQKIKNLLIDEKEGFDSAEMLGLNPLRTTSLLLILLDKKMLSLREYEESLLQLSESGYYLMASTYQRLLDEGRKISMMKGK